MLPERPIRAKASATLDGQIVNTRAILRLAPAGLLAYSAAVHSPTIDEVGHKAAGLS